MYTCLLMCPERILARATCGPHACTYLATSLNQVLLLDWVDGVGLLQRLSRPLKVLTDTAQDLYLGSLYHPHFGASQIPA